MSSLSGLGGDQGVSFYKRHEECRQQSCTQPGARLWPERRAHQCGVPIIDPHRPDDGRSWSNIRNCSRSWWNVSPWGAEPGPGSRERHRISRKRRRQLREWGEICQSTAASTHRPGRPPSRSAARFARPPVQQPGSRLCAATAYALRLVRDTREGAVIHLHTPSLRAQRSNPNLSAERLWIASLRSQ